MDPKDAVASYQAAWGEPDADARRQLLTAAWAEDAIYLDPSARVEGREALVQHIAGFRETFPGHAIEPTTDLDAHAGYLRFGWRMVDADGNEILEGVDFGTYAEDGKLTSIVGFFGPWPTLGS